MRVLITGGAGFIGSHVAKALKQAGHLPIVLDSLLKGHEESVKWGPFIKADLSDRNAIEKALKDHDIEAVIHMAALTNVRESFDLPDLYYTSNVCNTINLLTAMKACGIEHLIFSSTCAVYGVPKEFPINEKTPLIPVNPYGKSKLMCEEVFKDFKGLKYVALRYFNAAGADPDGELGETNIPPAHLIPIVVDAALNGTPFNLFGEDHDTKDGTPVRDYIHVQDLSLAHIKALTYLIKGGESLTFNLGTGKPYSVKEVIEEVEKQTGKKINIAMKPSHHGEPDHLECDYSYAEKILDWRPTHSSLSQLVRDTLLWQKAI
ncbi:MAG: UDP-glucose 4-epimerase [Chlamydiia bacterium]|nr:UDP-glucose 4-epimerase [Chlamydiia bacterium]MCH9615789.1 UDP-glucose 4-epimerase [Chlamydiia bacterium]MCH9628808.1 UDP-glucose 4-epimerase [Chlamydiia bacterium]